MKKLLILTIALALIMMSVAQAQGKIQFTGVSYGDEFGVVTGVGIPLGGHIWSFDYVTMGSDGDEMAGSEVAYIHGYKDGGFYFGALGGAGAGWKDGIYRITEVAGGLAGYKNFLAWAKYRLQLEKGTSYQNNFSFFFGVKAGI